MSQRIYRSARGSKIDMGDLILRNEDVRAVGNMGVNAKGDKIDNKGAVTKTRNEQVNKTYRKQIANQVADVPPQTSTVAPTPTLINEEPIAEVEGLDTKLEIPNDTPETKAPAKKTTAKAPKKKTKSAGLASAIAKAREVEQKKLKTEREEAKSTKGVKKI